MYINVHSIKGIIVHGWYMNVQYKILKYVQIDNVCLRCWCPRPQVVERTFSNICNHWLAVNIPAGDNTKGDIIWEYVGSGPPPESGKIKKNIFKLLYYFVFRS